MHDRGAPLIIYNSLTRQLEEFQPLSPGGPVGVYSCGPTVYAYAHIGNLRAYVFSDTVHRALLWKGYAVRKIINITDVGHLVTDADSGDDKLEVAARKSLQSVAALARHYEAAFHEDLARLRIIPADAYPRATDYISEMIGFAEILERKGAAYRLPNGLYFDTSRAKDYGRLAAMRTDEQREGARVEVLAGKRNKNDFALWRTEQPGERRLMRWASPWGWGAPGWHLECSVMSMQFLGDHFDVHTGGADHRALHHVNEIAQSEAYLDDGTEWVHYWMHGEFLNIKQAKMAKSEGTGLRLTYLMEQGFEPAAYRLLMLTAHYRSQTDFSLGALDSAATALRRLRNRVAVRADLPRIASFAQAMAAVRGEPARRAIRQMDEAISSDLNTARVLASLQEALRSDDVPAADQAVVVAAADHILGLALEAAPTGRRVSAEFEAEIRELLDRRERARERRDWSGADQIRAALQERGVQIRDTPRGPEWEVVS